MTKTSAGLLVYRRSDATIEVLLVHPGGPFWARKELGAWSIPKGEVAPGEDPLETARRELEEETGLQAPEKLTPLSPITQKSGKVVHAWAFEGDADPATLRSNTFTMEWPRGSGRMQEFPEVDRAAWFGIEEASRKLLPAQLPLLAELVQLVVSGRI
jgi:predicted NUDIX family NTP pyrophosphohydrolase